ncbi:MAG: hypothetical protein L0Y72_31620 [Gemmataceae bacterium]|nr:hypothetical protein [Gemmataceae bacterium]MCI0743602.1 hypothetical protein [Gemmataceae bacterium]
MSVHDLAAPKEDGGVLAYPALEHVGSLLEHNRRLFRDASISILDRSLGELRAQARAAAEQTARSYLSEEFLAPHSKLDVQRSGFNVPHESLPHISGQGLLVAGHQPELFHPGVWLKNFALCGLGKKHGVAPLNLIVDSDAAKNTLLRLPAGTPLTPGPCPLGRGEKLSAGLPLPHGRGSDGHPHVAQIPFDHGGSEAPFEERPILAPEKLGDFAARVKPFFAGWPFQPICEEFWQDLRDQSTPLLGERMVRARRLWERRWGCHNLEAPLSRLCQTEAFAWFACHLLSELPKLHGVYNTAVADYRRRYGLRSRNHPVPDLAKEGDWLEAPFWAWRAGQGRRQRLWVRQTSTAMELRSGAALDLPSPLGGRGAGGEGAIWPALPRGARSEDLVAAFRDLEKQGCKVRTRALTTTLFARLLLADLFIHGIGGGKYDELTDRLFRDFFGMPPPAYLILSGTLLLPFPQRGKNPGLPELERQLRDLHWNPQRYAKTAEAQELAAQKQRWFGAPCETSAQRRTRYAELRKLTAALRLLVENKKGEIESELAHARHAAAALQVTSRRDYAFCLYPEETLRPFLQRVLDE